MALIPYFWYTNNSKVLPYMLGALFISLYIGFTLSDTFQPLSEADEWGWSGLITGLAGGVMSIMHTQGVFFRTPPTTDEEIKLADNTAALATQLAALGFVAGYSVFFGVGPVIGLVLLARSALQDGRPNSMIAMPILLTFSIVNLMAQAEVGSDEQRQSITGLTLAVQGIILTLLSVKDDVVYDYETIQWESDEAFFAFMDRLGISGVLYSIIGLFIAFDSLNLDSMAYLLTTVYLVVVGIQGFSDEADARWRRGVGGYGSILTAFLFANSLESDLFSAVASVMSGMVALGFGFLFMQRMNEDDGIYEQAPATGAPLAETGGAQVQLPVEETQEEEQPTQEEPAMDLDEEEEMDVELDDELEEALMELDEVSEEVELDDELEKELLELDEEEAVEAEPVAEVEEEEPVVVAEPAAGHNGLLDTGEGFSLRLPKDAVDNIIASLDATPHDGFVPVVAFGPSGQIMLTFESPDKSA
tara:strand:- start:1684 stop:3105 length:1422 start_codon:yes stop_codon:yes gene_type:complete